MKLIIFSSNGGAIRSMCVSARHQANLTDETAKKFAGAGANCFVIDETEAFKAGFPFQAAWEVDWAKKKISINLDKAKKITKERLRGQREPLLEIQDVLYMRALETTGDSAPIIAEKKRLRDITLLVDNCSSAAELQELQIE